jgi:hypothetical protein
MTIMLNTNATASLPEPTMADLATSAPQSDPLVSCLTTALDSGLSAAAIASCLSARPTPQPSCIDCAVPMVRKSSSFACPRCGITA